MKSRLKLTVEVNHRIHCQTVFTFDALSFEFHSLLIRNTLIHTLQQPFNDIVLMHNGRLSKAFKKFIALTCKIDETLGYMFVFRLDIQFPNISKQHNVIGK
ncbi:Hypothetical predicted protein [Octopus vulgaris]|uniref:Uncharacterized protein n=1 Tax=Octopus vulgaris TaxID=6645 RepID=A0AA36AVE6_OCTVU|nr:Hypothetical predicted protein [Octopus vulgaris]